MKSTNHPSNNDANNNSNSNSVGNPRTAKPHAPKPSCKNNFGVCAIVPPDALSSGKIRNPNLEIPISENCGTSIRFEFWSIWNLSLFRASDLGLRICCVATCGKPGVRMTPANWMLFLHNP
jgi:hypothetical protein